MRSTRPAAASGCSTPSRGPTSPSPSTTAAHRRCSPTRCSRSAGWRGHFYVTTDRVGTPGFLDAEGARDLADRGHVIGSHSHTHPRYMGKLSREELLFEWGHGREVLTEILDSAPDSGAIPGGYL